ncbi:uncharacterized protein H6S33_000843 [Morchella sextelata]|uniref:uncharacterized protein n=1 Tax=Morchella sextelata TaxID=1174677 RepID=UPI001D053934|nr:uncharacterized protein H6S33_000843 [Morchella sextelata]KAH0615207.1 hypothetical protein H6S33_000843 [Morchella sextelata]
MQRSGEDPAKRLCCCNASYPLARPSKYYHPETMPRGTGKGTRGFGSAQNTAGRNPPPPLPPPGAFLNDSLRLGGTGAEISARKGRYSLLWIITRRLGIDKPLEKYQEAPRWLPFLAVNGSILYLHQTAANRRFIDNCPLGINHCCPMPKREQSVMFDSRKQV